MGLLLIKFLFKAFLLQTDKTQKYLQVLEVENEKLKSVNDELLKKDSGSTEVVKQLMADIESLQRGENITVETND